jgi:hypothetical protein
MNQLDVIIRESNPFHEGFRQMYRVLREQEERAEAEVQLPNVKMYLIYRERIEENTMSQI